jgi:hypothetical protein
MNELTLLENKVQGQSPSGTVPSLSWKDSPPTQHLLDVICSILAEEYIMIAKQNPGVFAEIASPLRGVRNDGL